MPLYCLIYSIAVYVWHKCGQRNLKKFEKINERSLRLVFNDNDSKLKAITSNRVGQPSILDAYIIS